MKKHILSFSLLMFLFLTGCSGTLLIVFNNTGQDMTVVSYDTVGQSEEYRIESGRSREVASPTRLVVKLNDRSWEYSHFPRLDRRYRDSGGMGPANYKFQIEKDGAIYLLLAKTKAPVSELPPQPEGFPLRPK